MKNKNSKIYIAGHNGLVGSAIYKNLKDKGYFNFILKSSNELDLRNQLDVFNFFEKEKPEYVFLAAAKVGGIYANNTYRADFIYDNLAIQNNIIYSAYKNNIKKMLFLGSTCIYPKNAIQPISENALLASELEYTNEPYAIAKIAGMKMCESFNLQYGTNFISVMPTNLYGENDNFDLNNSHVLPAMIRKMHLAKLVEQERFKDIVKDFNKNSQSDIVKNKTNEEIIFTLQQYGIEKYKNEVVLKLWGSGAPMREFLWSEDMADACVFIMENIDFKDLIGDKKEIKNTHINIGTGLDISIKDLAYMIKKEVGFNGKILFDRTKPDGTLRKNIDISKLSKLGWKHKVSLDEGVVKMYNIYKNMTDK
ncbi:GDP-L-fucose synthase [Campylobacter sp. faydin G-140]|uniref:GDP-L-fucose synthase family protein n=1 Tax=Campylobacter anatolicus TaxID=2829105 RepID=UPI001BA1F6FC|nr:GDP-L-fucose synthase [Campylobacter anatolicus]